MNRTIALAVAVSCSALGCATDEPGFPEESFECPATSLPDGPPHPRAAEFQGWVDDATAGGIPGAIVLIHDADGVWVGASGYADLASRVELQPCHRMLVASNTKPVMAAVILSLVEEGALGLDDPIGEHLDASVTDNIDHSESISVRHLLDHSSGIFNYTHTLEWLVGLLDDPEVSWTAQQCLEMTYGQQPYFPPGGGYEYSNTNFLLLGQIAESASGESTHALFEQRVFEPLQMSGATFERDDFGSGYVRGYYDLYANGTIFDVTERLTRDCMTEDGGMIATAMDLGRFMDGLVRDRVVLSEASLTQMLDARQQTEDEDTFYGLGINRFETRHGVAYGHSGSKFGYLSDMRYYPEHETTIVMLSNASGGPDWAYEPQFERIVDRLFEP